MDGSCNNIKLEIEMGRERGDSVISDDIEAILDVPIVKNKTLNEEEIHDIDEKEKIKNTEYYNMIIICLITIGGISCFIGIVYLLGYGLKTLLNLLII